MDKKKVLIIGGAVVASAAVVTGITLGVKKLIKRNEVVAPVTEEEDIFEEEVEVTAEENVKEEQ